MNSALHTPNCSNEPQLLLYFGLDVWIITGLSSSSFSWICCHFTTCSHLRKILFFYNHRTFCHHPICFCSKTWTFQGVPLSVIWNHDLFFMRTYDGKMCTGAAAWVGEMLLIERLGNTIFKSVHSYIRFLSKWKDFNNMFFLLQWQYGSNCMNGFHKPRLAFLQNQYSLKWATLESMILITQQPLPPFLLLTF